MDYSAAKDEELFLAYQKDDQHAFDVLLSRHKSGIYNFLYRTLGNRDLTDEAFQEVFFRVIKARHSYEPQAKFTTWVYTIARNLCIDLSRKKTPKWFLTVKDENSPDEGENDNGVVISDTRASAEEEISANDLKRKLQAALDKMNPDQREVFLLRENQGLSFEEIATVAGTSVNTVKSRMRYALEALREQLKKMGITDLKG